MALIVENGDIVANANSYNTRQELIDYAALRGVILPDDDTTDYKAVEAVDYLELFRNDYKGTETDPANQYLSFPREGITIGAGIVGKNTIPRKYKEAQAALVLLANSGLVLIPNRDVSQAFIKREKIGPIDTEFSETIAQSAPSLPTMPIVAALLAPFLGSTGGGVMSTYRA